MSKSKRVASVWLLGLLAVLNILDFATTYVALSMGGEEVNPLMLVAMEQFGTFWGLLLVKLLLIVIIFPYIILAVTLPEFVARQSREGFHVFIFYLLVFVNTVYTFVVCHNLNVIYTLHTWQV